MATLHWRLRIRTADDTADDIVVTSVPGGTKPYIAERGIPDGEGQTLNPVTGEVNTGAYTVGVIDAVDAIEVDELVASDGLEGAQATLEARGWVFADAYEPGDWAFQATDQVLEGTESLKADVSGGAGELTATRVFGPADGIQPLTEYVVRAGGRVHARAWFDVGAKLFVSGATPAKEDDVTISDAWDALEVRKTSTVDGELTVQLYRNGGFGSAQTTWFDKVEIWRHLSGVDRIITSRLADAVGKQQLLSRRSYLEESENVGSSWSNLVAGFLTAYELTTALRFTFTIGESRRIEQTTRVFEEPEPGFDRVSCLLGGPIIGDFGPIPDGGRPIFQVTAVDGDFVSLRWRTGYIYRPISESGAPLEDHNREFLNNLARQYLAEPGPFALAEMTDVLRRPFPDLRVRLFDLATDVGVTENYPAGISRDFVPVTVFSGGATDLFLNNVELGLLTKKDEITVLWRDDPSYPAQPAVGTRYKLACFPLTISDTNPLHWRGHPVDLATGLLGLRGEAYNAASAATAKEDIGPISVELRITGGMTLARALESLSYGPFGFAARTNDAGEHEFFLTRKRPSSVPVTTVGIDDLIDPSPPVFRVEEQTAVNRVRYRFRTFPPQPNSVVRDLTPIPIDFILATELPKEAVPDASDFEVYGDRSISYDLPGTPRDTNLDDFVAGHAAEIFEPRGRGAIVSELALKRGVTSLPIGVEAVLDLPHLPTANPTQTPVSQRGTTPRLVMVLRQTKTPAGQVLKVEDRGIALQAALAPEFTVVASAADPRKIATVTITNGVDLAAAGVTVRAEWAVSGSMPSSSRLLRTLDPATDALSWDTPPVCAGSVVWVRMRTEEVGKRPGDWTAFQSADLDDLDPPSGVTGVPINGVVHLSWTNGANAGDIPVEILLRVDGDTTWEHVITLPPGSTSYQLFLPDAATDYDVGVRHLEAPPFGCASAIATLDLAGDVAVQLQPPIDPVAFADGKGTFGLEVTATEFPSGVNVWVAVETAVGSGVAGTYVEAGTTPSVAGGRTSFTNPFVAPNDGKLRFLKARHTRDSWTPSDFTEPVSINPWLLIPPEDPGGDPEEPIGVSAVPVEIVFLGASVPEYFWAVPSARTVIGVSDKFPLDKFTAARIVVTAEETSLPADAFAAIEFEFPGSGGEYLPLDPDTDGPSLAIDPTAVDADLGLARESGWVPIAVEAQADVRLQAVLGGGDGDIAKRVGLTRVALQLTAADPTLAPPGEDDPLPPQDPGSCDVPSTVDDFAYADVAALEAAWPED